MGISFQSVGYVTKGHRIDNGIPVSFLERCGSLLSPHPTRGGRSLATGEKLRSPYTGGILLLSQAS